MAEADAVDSRLYGRVMGMRPRERHGHYGTVLARWIKV